MIAAMLLAITCTREVVLWASYHIEEIVSILSSLACLLDR